MERRIGPLAAELVQPESAKYAVPILLLHGLWQGASDWRPWMGHLAHRGWFCMALRWSGGPREKSGSADRPVAGGSLARSVGDLQAAIACLSSPPVLVGHDIGGLLALRLARSCRAAAALAPLLPGTEPASGLLRRAATGPIARFRRSVAAPGAWGRRPRVRESRELIRAVASDASSWQPLGCEVPRLIVVGERDTITPPGAARALADQLGTDFRVFTGAGHDLVDGPGWQDRVSDIHRWLVRQLGAESLLLYEESEREQE